MQRTSNPDEAKVGIERMREYSAKWRGVTKAEEDTAEGRSTLLLAAFGIVSGLFKAYENGAAEEAIVAAVIGGPDKDELIRQLAAACLEDDRGRALADASRGSAHLESLLENFARHSYPAMFDACIDAGATIPELRAALSEKDVDSDAPTA